MVDYKKMYLIMMDAAERAIELLTEAQRRCEEIYIEARETELAILTENNGANRE